MSRCSHGLPIEVKCDSCVKEALERVDTYKLPKSRKCCICKQKFVPRRGLQTTCAYPLPCEGIKADMIVAKQVKKREADQRRETKAKLAAMDGPKVLEPKARSLLQKLRRLEDIKAGYGCISCGKPYSSFRGAGHGFDGGHYRSVGSAKHMSLVPENIHLQCVYCNDTLASNPIGFRKGLVARYGVAYVEKLECDQESRKHTRHSLLTLIDVIRDKIKEISK